jgi:hypothetical protein
MLIVGGGLGSIAAVATGMFADSTATDRNLPEPEHRSFGGDARRVAFGRLLGDRNPQVAAIIEVAETSYEPARFAYDETHALETARAGEDAARRAAEDEARRAAEASEAEARAQRFPSDDWWYRIGRCEQPDGNGGVRWNTHGSNATTGVMFVGGLGIMEAAWNQFNVYGFPPGWRATPEQQMTIARDIYARYGPTAWSCSKTAGPAF